MNDRVELETEIERLLRAYVLKHREGANATLSFSGTVELIRIDVPYTGDEK